MKIRRVVTGHNGEGKAVFASDSLVDPWVVPVTEVAFHRLWGRDEPASFPDTGAEPEYRDFFPPLGGCRLGVITFPPMKATPPSLEDLKTAYAATQHLLPGLAERMEPASPGMHTSDTIDFGYVISGSIWLELDDGKATELRAGDTYVQNGTRHAWRNRSSEPCRILGVLIGAKRER
jgi:mannose-6-phosphate isomerase-like protein (cupin superfamily)